MKAGTRGPAESREESTWRKAKETAFDQILSLLNLKALFAPKLQKYLMSCDPSAK
jgi:hypothetical protein